MPLLKSIVTIRETETIRNIEDKRKEDPEEEEFKKILESNTVSVVTANPSSSAEVSKIS